MSSTRTTVIAIVVALLLLGAAAFLLFGQDSLSSSTTAEAGPASGAQQTFINLTAKIDPVAFDTSILDDARFKNLQDIRTTILPEASGRPDPFAPLGGGR
jgi:hypothetical protein